MNNEPLNQNSNDNYSFLSRGGEMGAPTRAFDWSKTPIDLPQNWPQSLRTTRSILLHSRFPMFLFWGPELICFYNDSYSPSLGKKVNIRTFWGKMANLPGPKHGRLSNRWSTSCCQAKLLFRLTISKCAKTEKRKWKCIMGHNYGFIFKMSEVRACA